MVRPLLFSGLLTEKKICGSVEVMVWSLIFGFDIFVSDKINPRLSLIHI